MTGDNWLYTIGVRVFQARPDEFSWLSLSMVNELAPGELVFGAACKAARDLIGLSQAQLSELSGASKKSINDHENELIDLRADVVQRLREALEREGARFLVAEGLMVVEVRLSRDQLEKRSRSPNVQAGSKKVRR